MNRYDDGISIPAFGVRNLCNEIELTYHIQINEACNKIACFFHSNENLPEVRSSISDLVKTAFYELYQAIEEWIVIEETELFPILKGEAKFKRVIVLDKIESIRETHNLILNVVQKLRQTLCDHTTGSVLTAEFKECIRQIFSLENNIYKWILEENSLFSKVFNKVNSEQVNESCY